MSYSDEAPGDVGLRARLTGAETGWSRAIELLDKERTARSVFTGRLLAALNIEREGSEMPAEEEILAAIEGLVSEQAATDAALHRASVRSENREAELASLRAQVARMVEALRERVEEAEPLSGDSRAPLPGWVERAKSLLVHPSSQAALAWLEEQKRAAPCVKS